MASYLITNHPSIIHHPSSFILIHHPHPFQKTDGSNPSIHIIPAHPTQPNPNSSPSMHVDTLHGDQSNDGFLLHLMKERSQKTIKKKTALPRW